MYGKIILLHKVVRINSTLRYHSQDNSKKLLELLGSMPKVKTGRIVDAQRQRLQISKKAEKYGPSIVYLQVLGSGARGAPNTLYLFTDQKRYLFNCGEGSQRLAHEHKVKLSRLNHIFITNKTWQNIGGLPGLSLTLQDVGVPNITLHGPEGLDELYNATKRFVIMKEMNVTMAKCSPSEDFEDNVMTVKYILMDPQENILEMDPKPGGTKTPKLGDTPSDKEFEEFIHDNTDYYKRERKNTESQNVEKPKSDKGLLKTKNDLEEKVLQKLQKHNNCTVAYICTIKKRLGTLDLEKCVQFGVKPGPLLGQLKSGQDVVLPDGTLVKSKDVKTPDDPGPVFIVLEVPELSYLKESEFAAHFDNGVNPTENIPIVIVHYTPPHIFNHPKYRSFMSMFGPTTRHLVLNSQNSCLGSESVHRTQHKLHLLDSDIFPLLRDTSIPAVWSALPQREKPSDPLRLRALEELKHNVAMAQFQDIINLEGSCGGDTALNSLDPSVKLELIAGRTLSIFHIRPKKELDRSVEPKLHIQEYIQEPMDVDGFVPSLEHFRQLVEDTRYAKSGSQKEYPKVVFLGTGSCIPSKTRNTSAIVLHIDKNRSMLLDCGEGTFGQLVRFYGPKRVNEFLRTLKAIYVSHLHADHHIGLIGVLQARREALAETNSEESITPLYLLAPGQIVSWLSIYDQHFERIRGEFTLIPNQKLLESNLSESTDTDMTSAVLASIGVQYIRTCQVAHCPNAFGVAIDVDQEYKVTYSGDTIPCEELVRIGKNSTLLIHEATMEDELSDEARVKMHSTTSQAIEIGKKMNAKYTVLTHFSQRYARLPRLNTHILNDNNSVGIAFDNMQITMSDLELLPHMYAPLQLMFAEHCVELELKAANRARLKERRPSPPNFPSLVTHKKPPRSAARCTPVTGDKHSSPSRKTSPSCGILPAAPENDGHVTIHYKDSHASRLRRQRGRATAKIMSELRNKSCSPNRNNSASSSPASSPCRNPFLSLQRSPALSRTASQSSSTVKNNQTKYQNGPTTKTTRVIDTRSKTLHKAPISTSSLPDGVKNSNKTKYNLTSEKENSQTSIKTPRLPVIPWRVLEKPLPKALPSNKQNIQPRSSTSVVPSSSKVKTNSNSRTNMIAIMKTAPMPNSVKPVTQLPISSNSKQCPQRNSNDNTCLKSYNQLKPTHVAYTRNTTNWNTGPTQRQTLRNRFPQALTSKKENIETQVANSSACLRERSVEKKRKSTLPIKNFPHYSSKSFKPKLEDIKSSYLLLNNNNNKKLANQEENANNKVIKSLPLSEQQRKEKLLQAMKKFKSKSYWNDSKYERIEGLSWITWK